MPINVVYQVPTSLMQQQRQAERRAYRRQVNLMTMQQNFQREQTEANRQFQRETMQTAYDRQREKTADERAYQQELLAHKEGREDALRKQAMELAEKQQQEAQIQQAETAAWQDSERQRQALEKQFNYTDTQIAEMKQLAADERDAYQQYSQGLISPEQYRSALGQLRARRMGIMPETPKKPEETMSVEERLKASTWTDPKGNCWYFDKNGEPKIAMPPNGSVSEKLVTAKGNAILEAAKFSIAKETGVINKETYQFLKKELNANFATGDEPAEQPKFSVPQTGPGYVKQNMGGGNPLQQMKGQMGGQQQPMQEPMSSEQQDELAAKVEGEAKQAERNFSFRERRRIADLEKENEKLTKEIKAIEAKRKREGAAFFVGRNEMMEDTLEEDKEKLKQNMAELSRIRRGESTSN